MKITTNLQDRTNFQGMTKRQFMVWKYLNGIPRYTDATYDGFTGLKNHNFPLSKHYDRSRYPDITQNLHEFESEILQELKDCRAKRFGYIRALWKMCQNFSTGDLWDSKFLPKFPGRNPKGKKQFAIYQGKIVSGNDVSNMVYGHACRYMGIPIKLAQFIGRLDARGIFEPFSKGKLPSRKLLRFKDTASDQLAIAKGMREFDINNYNLK